MRAHRVFTPSLLAVLVANVLLAFGAVAAEPVKVVVLDPGSGALETLLRREVAAAAQLGKFFSEIVARQR